MKKILFLIMFGASPLLFSQCYFNKPKQERIAFVEYKSKNYMRFYDSDGVVKMSPVIVENGKRYVVYENKKKLIDIYFNSVPSLKIGQDVFSYVQYFDHIDYSSCDYLLDIDQ